MLTRRGSLVRLAGSSPRASESARWRAADGTAGVASGAVQLRAHARADRRAVLHRRREAAPQHHRGKARHAAPLRATVVDASTCRPIRGAAVDIWHATPAASTPASAPAREPHVHARHPADGRDGVALFQTVYPGWYTGRTVHIHVKVHVGGNVVHTGQLFFPDRHRRRLQALAVHEAAVTRHPERDDSSTRTAARARC